MSTIFVECGCWFTQITLLNKKYCCWNIFIILQWVVLFIFIDHNMYWLQWMSIINNITRISFKTKHNKYCWHIPINIDSKFYVHVKPSSTTTLLSTNNISVANNQASSPVCNVVDDRPVSPQQLLIPVMNLVCLRNAVSVIYIMEKGPFYYQLHMYIAEGDAPFPLLTIVVVL